MVRELVGLQRLDHPVDHVGAIPGRDLVAREVDLQHGLGVARADVCVNFVSILPLKVRLLRSLDFATKVVDANRT